MQTAIPYSSAEPPKTSSFPPLTRAEVWASLAWTTLIYAFLLFLGFSILLNPAAVPEQVRSLGEPVRAFIGILVVLLAHYALGLGQALMVRVLRDFAAIPPALVQVGLYVVFLVLGLAYGINSLASDIQLNQALELILGNSGLLIALALSLLLLWRMSRSDPMANGTRFGLMTLFFVAMVGAVLYLIQTWSIFFGFEALVTGFMDNSNLVLGIALAYALFWLGGRQDENSPWRARLELIGLGIGGLTLIALLLLSGFLDGMSSILGSYIGTQSQIGIWIATAVAIISGVLAWIILHRGQAFGETTEQQVAWQGWIMLAPNIIGFTLFFAGPLLLSLYLSFTNSTAGAVPEFVGITNYTRMLSLEFQMQSDLSVPAQSALSFGYRELFTLNVGQGRLVVGAIDPIFWQSLRNTLVYALLLLPLSIIPAIGLALILNSSLPGMKFYRAIYFLPSVAAVVGTALIWRWLYDPVIGFFNYFITQFVGFLTSLGVPATDPSIRWLSDPGVVMFSVVFLGAWQVVGYNTVLFLAGLQGIPKDMYEAGSIDGANGWRQFWYITLPLLRPTTFFVLVTTIVTALQVFNEPYALFPSRPLPIQATPAVFYLYTKGFNEFQFGYASAVAWVLFILIFSITLIQFRLQRNNPND